MYGIDQIVRGSDPLRVTRFHNSVISIRGAIHYVDQHFWITPSDFRISLRLRNTSGQRSLLKLFPPIPFQDIQNILRPTLSHSGSSPTQLSHGWREHPILCHPADICYSGMISISDIWWQSSQGFDNQQLSRKWWRRQTRKRAWVSPRWTSGPVRLWICITAVCNLVVGLRWRLQADISVSALGWAAPNQFAGVSTPKTTEAGAMARFGSSAKHEWR